MGVIALMLACVTAQASVNQKFVVGVFRYCVITENKTAKTGTVGVAAANASSISGEVVIPESVTNGGITYTVTKIQYDQISGNLKGFYGCSNITSIVIPNTVTTINSSSFKNCTKLTNVVLPNSLTELNESLFEGCSLLTEITIPENVTKIGSKCFDGTNLKSVTIEAINPPTLNGYNNFPYSNKQLIVPDGTFDTYKNSNFGSNFNLIIEASNVSQLYEYIEFEDDNAKTICIKKFDVNKDNKLSVAEAGYVTSIGYAFNNSKIVNFKELRYFTRLLELPSSAFYGLPLETIELPNSLTSIGSSCFKNCKQLRNITLPNSITNIGTYAFENCTNLEEIILSDHLVNIEYGAFHACTKLSSINLPKSLEKIGGEAFKYCTSLEQITIPQNVNLLGQFAFQECTSLTTAIFENNETKDVMKNASVFWLCTSLVDVQIPSDFNAIGTGFFKDCSSLETIALPQNLTELEPEVFCNCSKLKNITLPNKVELINEKAFNNCISLTELNTPTNLKEIGRMAFENTALQGFYLPDGVIINERAFDRCNFTSLDVADNAIIKLAPIYDFIEPYLWAKNTSLTSVNYNAKLLYGFCGNSNLQEFSIGNNVEVIGNDAFASVDNLRIIKIPNSVKAIGKGVFYNNKANAHITLPSYLEHLGTQIVRDCPRLSEITIPAYVKELKEQDTIYVDYTPEIKQQIRFVDGYSSGELIPASFEKDGNGTYTGNAYGVGYQVKSVYVMGNEIPKFLIPREGNEQTIYVKKSVFFDKYANGKIFNSVVQSNTQPQTVYNFESKVDYKIPLAMINSSGVGIEYKTLCRDFDVDLTHTNDNLPEGVEPLRAYLVDDVDGDLRMVFMNEIKYIPSRLKANTTDEFGNRYKGVDEYVGVILRGSPGYTYYYEMGEHDYTQGDGGQWLMEDAMAYSNSIETNNLLAGDANDEFYVYKTVEDEDNNEIVNYGLNSNRFKIYYKNGWLNYNKAYLQLPKDVADAVERETDQEGNANLTFVFNNADGTTDKVSSVEFNRNCESDIFYNPYGQRVDANTKGIVIKNGKKYVNK